jgi:hypothetical protein
VNAPKLNSGRHKILAPGLAKDTIRAPQDISAWANVALRDLALHERHAACVDAAGDVYQWGAAYYGDLVEGQSGEPHRTLSGKVCSCIRLELRITNLYQASQNISKIALSAARVFALSENTGKIYVLSQTAERQKLSTSGSSWWSLGGWLSGSPSVDYLELTTNSKLNRGEKCVSPSDMPLPLF